MAVADPLEFAIDSLGYRSGGGLAERGVNHVGAARQFVWRDLLRKTDVSATYFRGSVPLVAFASAEDEAVPAVQRQLWNFSRIPLLIAGTSSGIGVYSCYVAPSRPDDASSTALYLASPQEDLAHALAPFSRAEVEAGRLAAKRPEFFNRSDRVDRKLLRNLRQLRARLKGSPQKNRAIDALIGRSIFIRYLEDRKILTDEHFHELSSYSMYTDALRAGVDAAYELFSVLGAKFNGDVFSVATGEHARVEDADLRILAGFLDGDDVASGQASFWPYDFSVIPSELISSIYEQLLEESQDADAAYYTPRRVVDLILDEVLPWEQEGTPRVFDPACGSGVFLTEAYRRLVFHASQDSPNLSFNELAALLKASIFGVDQSAVAVSVAAFGLYLALLEELDPPTAWADAKLPQLIGENLLIQDFFEEPLVNSDFDVIVGNPPWKKQLPPAAARFVIDRGYPVAAKQLAHAFLWRALELLKPGGMLGLLMPAKLLHNKSGRAIDVRRHLFDSADVETIIDLSILRKGLFEAAVAPAAVLIARARTEHAQDGDGPSVLHVVPRSSPLQATVDGFVVSPLDIHTVPRRLVASHADVWKVLLWGDERDLDVINRVRSRHRLLRAVADERGWMHGRGFELTGPDRYSADAIVGMPFVPTDSIQPFRTEFDDNPVSARVMHRPRDPRLYRGPHVLIRRGAWNGRLAAALGLKTSAFNNAVFGISAPTADADHLRLLTAYVNSAFGNYYHFLTSSSWGVERDALEANEHLSLPFAEPKPAAAQEILALLEEGEGATKRDPEWWRRLDDSVFRAYDIEDAADQIRDTLRTSLDQFTQGVRSASFRAPSSHDRLAYQQALRSTLRESLVGTPVAVDVVTADSPFMVATVTFEPKGQTRHSTSPRTTRELADLIEEARVEAENWPSPVVILQPSALLLRETQAHVLRPAEGRYWTVARARADAAEIIGEIAKVGGQPPGSDDARR